MPETTSRPWWQTAVIYQIYPRSFYDANDDGIGDLAGVLDKLDYLAHTLGIDAVWLSPFYPSPMADFGYDVADYCDVDPIFGDLDTFDRLAEAVHAHGLRLIVDFVPNHTSDQHPWFVEARAARDSAKRDWYVWRDPAPGGGPPNNWLSVFGGPAWTLDEATGQYYLHSFLRQQPDLNWRHPDVVEAMFDVLRFWLDRGVDGFRIDVAHSIMKDPDLRDNPPNPGAGDFHKVMGAYDSQLHLHDKGHDDVHAVYRDLRRFLDTYDDREAVAIGEIHLYDMPAWARYYGDDLDGLHMPFNFSLLKADFTAASIRAHVDALEAAIPEGAWPNYVLGNHDERRLASRYGEAGARLAAVLLLTLRGTPTLYYGDEIGLREADIPPDEQQDPWGRQVPGLGRDGCRTPMQWTAAPHAGFTHGSAPWLPVQADYEQRNVAYQHQNPASLLNLYRALLALRRATPALQHGAYEPLDDVPDTVFAFLRRAGGATFLVALNFGEAPARLDLPTGATGRVRLSTHPARQGTPAGPALALGGYEGAVIELEKE